MTFLNEAGHQLIGLPFDKQTDISSLGIQVKDLFFPEDVTYITEEFLPQVVADGHGVTEVRFRHVVTGRPIWVDYAKFVVRDSETGEISALMSITRDIRERKRQEAEQERLHRRERNIAKQLQEALLPKQPDYVPGLGVHSCYRVALQEAGVGGDFSDCFSNGGGELTCFVVADVSGKGLRAASQIAMVRNMLRYAMYENESVASAVSQLNRVLVNQECMEGFATLLVGTYDPRNLTFTYVNCGQEPGLLLRASSASIDYLDPTGPVLGAYIDEPFTQKTISLEPGDVLSLFTDGLTEVGPSRTELLGVNGVARLLAEAVTGVSGKDSLYKSEEAATRVAEEINSRLIESIERHAGGADKLGDDIALLTAVVSDKLFKNKSK